MSTLSSLYGLTKEVNNIRSELEEKKGIQLDRIEERLGKELKEKYKNLNQLDRIEAILIDVYCLIYITEFMER